MTYKRKYSLTFYILSELYLNYVKSNAILGPGAQGARIEKKQISLVEQKHYFEYNN